MNHDIADDDDEALDPMEQELDRLLQRDEDQRINTFFGFPRCCPSKACRRHRRCSGEDAMVCRRIFWPVVPEELKVWFRSLVESRRTNRTFRQADRAANKALQDFRLHEKSLAQLMNRASVASHK